MSERTPPDRIWIGPIEHDGEWVWNDHPWEDEGLHEYVRASGAAAPPNDVMLGRVVCAYCSRPAVAREIPDHDPVLVCPSGHLGGFNVRAAAPPQTCRHHVEGVTPAHPGYTCSLPVGHEGKHDYSGAAAGTGDGFGLSFRDALEWIAAEAAHDERHQHRDCPPCIAKRALATVPAGPDPVRQAAERWLATWDNYIAGAGTRLADVARARETLRAALAEPAGAPAGLADAVRDIPMPAGLKRREAEIWDAALYEAEALVRAALAGADSPSQKGQSDEGN